MVPFRGRVFLFLFSFFRQFSLVCKRLKRALLSSVQVGKAFELKKVIDYAAMTTDGPQVLVESILDQVWQATHEGRKSSSGEGGAQSSSPRDVTRLEIRICEIFQRLTPAIGRPDGKEDTEIDGKEREIAGDHLSNRGTKLELHMPKTAWHKMSQRGVEVTDVAICACSYAAILEWIEYDFESTH